MSLIENNLETLQMYYDAISKIRKALDAVCEGNETGFNSWPKPNPYYDRTSSSIVICFDVEEDYMIPIYLYSPFGEVKIFSGKRKHFKKFYNTVDWELVNIDKVSYVSDRKLVNDKERKKGGWFNRCMVLKRIENINLPIDNFTCNVSRNMDSDQYKKDRKNFEILSNGKNCF